MATVTPNFNWPVPTSTDLVKDGATAIEALGDSIDASLVDLKGGTTGQVLSKNSNTDMDFTWVTDAAGDITGVTAGIGISGGGTSGTVTVTNSMATAIDAKGDLVPGTGADTFARLAVGANGTVLTADSAEATGLKWVAAASGSTFAGCKLYKSADQSCANNTDVNITFDSEIFDTDGFHSTSTNTDRITIPTGKAGKYSFTGQITFSSNSTGQRWITISDTGANVIARSNVTALSGDAMWIQATGIASATVGDYFILKAYQTSGSTLQAIGSSIANTTFSATYLGA
jgi:hypothetical protein